MSWGLVGGGLLDGPTVLWESSFTPPPGSSWEELSGVVEASRTNAEVLEHGPAGTRDVLQIAFGHGGSRWGIDYRHSFAEMGVPEQTEVFFSYDVYFAPDFQFIGDGKMGGLSGISQGMRPLDTSSGGRYDERSFSVRAMWKEDRGVVMYLYARHADGRDFDDPRHYGYGLPVRFVNADGSSSDVFRPGVWHRVEHHVKLNTPGDNDGVYEMWVDGHKGITLDDVQYRTEANRDLTINQLFSAWFFGGSSEEYPTRVNHAYTDDWLLTSSYSNTRAEDEQRGPRVLSE